MTRWGNLSEFEMVAPSTEVKFANLALARKVLGVTQMELAEKANVTRQTVARIENGLPVRDFTAAAVAQAIDEIGIEKSTSVELQKITPTDSEFRFIISADSENEFRRINADIERLCMEVAYLELQIEASDNNKARRNFVERFTPVFRRFLTLSGAALP